MEFGKKLQELRKRKGLTQEELAQALFVSRTAISKWESGRGYPNIDSLKAIAKFFCVSVDDLLSGEQVLTIAEEEQKEKSGIVRDLIFGLLDICSLLLLFLPFFGQRTDGKVQAVSLLSLDGVSVYLRILFFDLVSSLSVAGLLTLTLQNSHKRFWVQAKTKLSLILNAFGVLVFIVALQPYAAVFWLVFFLIKVLLLLKRM